MTDVLPGDQAADAAQSGLVERAAAVHRSAIVFDAVNRCVLDEQFLSDVSAGNVSVLGRTILVSDPAVFSPFGFEESLRNIVEIHEFVSAHPNRVQLIRSTADIHEAKVAGRTGIYVYFQSPEPLGKYPWRLRLFYELGLRILQMTYNERALTGDGAAEPTDAGLSDYGRAVIRNCNRLGIALDVSHCGDRTTMETIEASETPVLITHGNSRTVTPNPRCKTDEQVRACVKRGGVVGVMAFAPFMNDGSHEPCLDDLFLHIDHYADVIGPENISLGLDILTGHETDDFKLLGYKDSMYSGWTVGGINRPVHGIERPSHIPRITEGLVRRGYADDQVRGILGGNLVRVLEGIWK